MTIPRYSVFAKSLPSVLLIAAFLLAVGLRFVVGGAGPAHSPTAGLWFAAILLVGSGLMGCATKINLRVVLIGLVGAAVLCLPVLVQIFRGSLYRPDGNYLQWALVVSVVALTEEAFLRGTLYDHLTKWRNEKSAIIIAAILFTILHIPLYGWHIVPLDLLVGIWLGLLKNFSGSWVAPGIAHTAADLVSWWFV